MTEVPRLSWRGVYWEYLLVRLSPAHTSVLPTQSVDNRQYHALCGSGQILRDLPILRVIRHLDG